MQIRSFIASMFLGLTAWFIAPPAHATIINVPADYASIQSAIDASSNGDTVIVAPGRYLVNLNFRSKDIVLAGSYLLSGNSQDIWNTILDGSAPDYPDTGSVIIVAGLQDTSTAIIGFTITGGTGTNWRDISDNRIYREGGGILTESSWPRIQNNIIINNRATTKGIGVSSAGGGGIRVGFSGGIGRLEIIGNVFAYNQGLYGGGLVSFHCPIVFRNNIVWQNSGGQDYGGAGLWVWNNGTLGVSLIENNTIIGNSTANQGGGISVNNSQIDIHNNIVRGNSGVPAQLYVTGPQSTTVWYNNVQDGYPGTGNTDAVPLFADSNFYLLPGSPGIDEGDPDLMYNDREDVGNPGNALWPAMSSLLNDQGAYGGLTGPILPLFTSPFIEIITDSLDMGTVGVGSFSLPWILVGKAGYGPILIDSMRFGHTPSSELYNLSSLPIAYPPQPWTDSVQLLWNPSAEGTLLDTARIYHSDSTSTSPLLVIVTGKVSCCSGVTGNVDQSDGIDLSDLSLMISYMIAIPKPSLPCFSEADINISSNIDLSDLSILVAYMTTPPGTVTLPACP